MTRSRLGESYETNPVTCSRCRVTRAPATKQRSEEPGVTLYACANPECPSFLKDWHRSPRGLEQRDRAATGATRTGQAELFDASPTRGDAS